MINQVAGLVDFTTLRINSSQTALYQIHQTATTQSTKNTHLAIIRFTHLTAILVFNSGGSFSLFRITRLINNQTGIGLQGGALEQIVKLKGYGIHHLLELPGGSAYEMMQALLIGFTELLGHYLAIAATCQQQTFQIQTSGRRNSTCETGKQKTKPENKLVQTALYEPYFFYFRPIKFFIYAPWVSTRGALFFSTLKIN